MFKFKSLKAETLIWIFLLVVFLVALSSCACQNPNNDLTANRDSGLTKGRNWEEFAFEEMRRRLEDTDLAPLKTKTGTNDSTEIRVWVGFDASPLRAVILRRDGRAWEALYLPALNKRAKPCIQNVCTLPGPKSGWDSLRKQLTELEVSTLPDWTEIGLKPDYLDIETVVIETRIQNAYRNYMSFGFELSEHKDVHQVHQVAKICELLSREFEVKLLDS